MHSPVPRRRVVAAGAVALGVLVSSGALVRPAAAQFGANLLANGGAEAGPGSITGDVVVAVPGWATTGNLTAVQYGAGDLPGPTSPGPAARGANFFAGGPNSATSSATQTVGLSTFAGLAGLVDAGRVGFTLAGYLGGYLGQNDAATLTAEFLGAGAVPVGSVALGPVLAADRGGVTGLVFRSAAGVLPAGTRDVRVTLVMTRRLGAYNDGYADDLALVLTDTVVPEPATWALAAAGLAALGACARGRQEPRSA